MTFWDLLPPLSADDQRALDAIDARVQGRRAQCPVKVGSMDRESAATLRQVVRWAHPRVVVEIGTGLGYSTEALLCDDTETLYTCDRHDAGVRSDDPRLQLRSGTESTALLAEVEDGAIGVDLFFLDARLRADDAERIARLCQPDAVIVCDDYVTIAGRREKGIANAEAVMPRLPGWTLVAPRPHRQHQMAAIVPAGVA